MYNVQPLQNFFTDLAQELHHRDILWQSGVLAFSLLIAWLLNRAVKFNAGPNRSVLKLGVGGIKRVIFPFSALLLVLLGKAILGMWFSVKLLKIAIPLLGALAIIRITIYILRYLFKPGGWVAASERMISYLVWIGFALYITGLLPEILSALDSFGFSIGKQHFSLLLMLQGGLAIVVTLLLSLWFGGLVEQRIMRAEHMDMSLRAVLSKFVRAILIVLGILIVLPAVGIDLTVLSFFGGALGVGLGFGLQKIASNYISGFIILLDRSVRLGDLITADTRYGVVSRLTSRYVVVRGMDGTEAIIPNDTLISTTVINHSYSTTEVRIGILVQISYDSDVEKAMQLLLQIAKNYPRILENPASQVFLLRFAENGIDLELGFWIADPEVGQTDIRSEINLEIWRTFKQNNIQIPYPRRDITIVGNIPTTPA